MIQTIVSNGHNAYNLAAGKSLPEFLNDKKSRTKRNRAWTNRLELIQDLDFPLASSRVKVSPDGEFIVASGTYPPLLKIFDTKQLALKHYRGLDAEVVDLKILSEDYRKIAMLQSNRTVELHAQGGHFAKVRIPKPGRAMTYIPPSTELLVVGGASEMYRLNLAEGRFLSSVPLSSDGVAGPAGANCLTVCPSLPLVAVGGCSGKVSLFDWRELNESRRPVFEVQLGSSSDDNVSTVCFSGDGRFLGAGDSEGVCHIWDIRKAEPLVSRDHRCQTPIVDMHIVRSPVLNDQPVVVSADASSVRLWTFGSARTDDLALDPFHLTEGGKKDFSSELLVSLVTCAPAGLPEKTQLAAVPGNINSLAIVPQSGLVLTAQDNPRMGVYFVPLLGRAPTWCRFLDALTADEEYEASKEIANAPVDNFTFVTLADLEQVKATELLGTKVIKPALHGFYVDTLLWKKLRTAAGVVASEEWAKQKETQRQKERMRIKLPRAQAKVNDELARRLEKEAQNVKKKVAAAAESVLHDERFQELFSNPGFAIEVSRSAPV